ncbi:MAG: hypothetical protein AAFO84_01765 [Cyanobacteria bacterium J06598_1]
MMNQLNNWFSNVSAYAEMSPDLTMRLQINQWLHAHRRDLSAAAWCRRFADHSDNAELLSFVYQQFSEYSGLSVGCVRPEDTLHGDLHFALVCWHDWVITFCEDFMEQFELDLSDCFDEDDFETVGEMMTFLSAQLATVQETPDSTSVPHLTALPSVAIAS